MPAAAEREVLKNGIPVIFEHNDSSAITFLQLLVRGGKRAEPVEKQGLSFLATRLAAEVPDSGKAQELTRLAARFSVTSRGDFSLINIECLTVSLEPTLRILSRIVASPLFSGLRVDAIKKYMAHRSRMDEDDSLIVGHLAALSAFFGSAGYGGPAHGNEESLRAIKGKDASDFYRRHFSAANILLAVSSDLNKEEILSLLDSAFGSLPQGEPASFAPVALRIPGEKKIFIQRETKQSLVSRAFPLGRITPRGYVLNELLGNFLGKGSGSKLWPLRSEAKLAYNVDCRVTQMSEGGMLEAYLETDNTKKDEALQALEKALADVRDHGLSEEDFEAARAMTKTNFLRNSELKQAKAATLAAFEALGLGFEYFSKFLAELDSLDREEVESCLREVLDPERAIIVVVGPSH